MRDLTISLEPTMGTCNRFYAFVASNRWIAADGDRKRSKKGQIGTSQVKITVRVFGIGEAQYKLGLDLPGTVDDQSLTFNLSGGYHETEILI